MTSRADELAFGAGVPRVDDRAQQAERGDRDDDADDCQRRPQLVPERVAQYEERNEHAQVPVAVSRRARPSRDGSSRCAFSAAFGSCVTMMIVLPISSFSRSSRPRISSAVVRSRSPVGSSATMMVGSVISARAIATRCCWPPDSSFGRCVARSDKPDQRERRCDALAPLAARQRRELQRQLDVAERRQHRHQVVELEDEADVRRAPQREVGIGQLCNVDAGDANLARRRLVDAGDQVQQRRLARARRAHQRDVVAAHRRRGRCRRAPG